MNARSESPRAAFEAVVVEHQGTVLRICRSILRDDHLGDDAAQEAFLRLWQRLRSLSVERRPREIGPWLRRVAVSTAVDAARSRRSRGDALARLTRGADPAALVEAAEPADRASLSELEHRLEVALDRLPEGQRTVFLLRHRGGLALSEVADALGIAVSTAKTQFARACTKLQADLNPYRPDGDRA